MRDEDIDTSDIPPVPPEMFARGVVRKGLKPVARKQLLTLQLDSDVLAWFKAQGREYEATINNLLRAYMDDNKSHKPKQNKGII